MKTVFYFIFLKITEISAIVFIPHYTGALIKKFPWLINALELPYCFPCWPLGLLAIIVFCVCVFLGWVFIAANLEWAKSLSQR